MQRSTARIFTTHVGSLARAASLIPLLRLREQGQPYDHEALARRVRDAVNKVVRKQIAALIDIVSDGADCGFAASALGFNDTHPSVA